MFFFCFFFPLEEEPLAVQTGIAHNLNAVLNLEERGAAAKTGRKPEGKKTDVR